MKKYTYTQHTPAHIQLPKLDKDGNIVMIQPDPKDVKAAIAANAANDKAIRLAMADPKNAGLKRGELRVAPIVNVPVAVPDIDKDITMVYGEAYDLPETDEQVKHLVSIGYLKECANVPVKAATAPVKAEVKKEETKQAAPAKEIPAP
jgi:hypothetical protein